MEILKWYSFIILTIANLFDVFKIIKSNDKEERIGRFLGLIIYVPISIFLLLI